MYRFYEGIEKSVSTRWQIKSHLLPGFYHIHDRDKTCWIKAQGGDVRMN